MKNNVIETSIDELMRFLKEKGKMNISEAADFLNITQREVEPLLNILEENGIIEIKYPVIGEPKLVLKSTAPEKIDIKALQAKPEKIEEKTEPKVEEKKIEVKPEEIKKEGVESDLFSIEKPKIKERIEIKPEIVGEETKDIVEKVERLETKITELSHDVDVSLLKEELSEILLIIAGLRDIEKISFYLKEILGLVHKMKEKRMWTDEDKDLIMTMLEGIAANWKEYGENEIASVFERIKEKVKTA